MQGESSILAVFKSWLLFFILSQSNSKYKCCFFCFCFVSCCWSFYQWTQFCTVVNFLLNNFQSVVRLYLKLPVEPAFLSISTKFEYCVYFRELSQVFKYAITSNYAKWICFMIITESREMICCSSFAICWYAFLIALLSLYYISHSNYIIITYITVGNAIDIFLSIDWFWL